MLVDGDTIALNSDVESQRSYRVKFLDGKKNYLHEIHFIFEMA